MSFEKNLLYDERNLNHDEKYSLLGPIRTVIGALVCASLPHICSALPQKSLHSVFHFQLFLLK
jgi:hypothetical protein